MNTASRSRLNSSKDDSSAFACGFKERLTVAIFLVGCAGCFSSPPPPLSAKITTEPSVDLFQVGDHDLTAPDSSFEVKIGDTVKIVLKGKVHDFPEDLHAGTIKIVAHKKGKKVVMQSGSFTVSRHGDLIKILSEMSIPKPPCVGLLQILNRDEVLLERPVSVVE